MPCDVSEMPQRQFYYFGTYLMEEEIINCWQSAAIENHLRQTNVLNEPYVSTDRL
jgi:hypothetical protein